MNNTVIFPGSFDPLTNGHLNLIERASMLFTHVVVGVAKDTTGRQAIFSYEERCAFVNESLMKALNNRSNISVKGFNGLLVDFYHAESANAVIRGLRSAQDFAYEMQLANVNKKLLPTMETILLMATPEHACISASMVREIAFLGGDISAFVPMPVAKAFARLLRVKNG